MDGRGHDDQLVPRVLIAEANALVRAGLRSFLTSEGLDVVGEATSGAHAAALVASLAPDVVLLDSGLSGPAAIVALREILEASPRPAVVMLAASVERHQVVAAMEAGASGYLLKDQGCGELVAGVRAAAVGSAAIAPQAMVALIEPRVPHDDHPLTARELEVLGLVADGFSNKEIAGQLGVTEGTVKSHLGSAFRRIGATRRTQAALWVHEHRSGGGLPSGG